MKEKSLTEKQKELKDHLARAKARMLKKLDIKLTLEDNDHGVNGCATCRKRATYAAAALKVYLQNGGDAFEDFDTLFSDFLTDLRHLAAHLKVDFDEAIDGGEMGFGMEVSGEEEQREYLKAQKK